MQSDIMVTNNRLHAKDVSRHLLKKRIVFHVIVALQCTVADLGGGGSGGSIEPPKSKQLTSKTCENIRQVQSILNAKSSLPVVKPRAKLSWTRFFYVFT